MAGQGSASSLRRFTHGEADAGYAMVALLVALGVMAVMLSAALPTWRTIAQRERESELVFRGQQYARAISLFQRKYANAFPPTIDALVEQKFLRRKFIDPVTGGEFQVLYVGDTQPGATAAGAGDGPGRGTAAPGRGGATTAPAGLTATPLGGRAGIMGVTSKSTAPSIREYNGRTKYNEWVFIATQATVRAGGPTGGQTPTDGDNGGVQGGGRNQGPGSGIGGPGRGGQPQPGDGGRRGGRPFGPGQNQPFSGSPFGGGRL